MQPLGMEDAMRLLCELGRHRPGPRPRWNEGYYFSKCEACGHDLVRTPFERWQVPRGYRVVWSPQPPENRQTARLVPAPPWTPADGDNAAQAAPASAPATESAAAPVAVTSGEDAALEAATLAAPIDTQTIEADDPSSAAPEPVDREPPAATVRSVFTWADPQLVTADADAPPDDLSIGEVLRILREEDARAGHEPEGGTIAPASEPLELELELPQGEAAGAGAEPIQRGQALTPRRQRSRRGLRVAIATALALAGAAVATHYAQAAAPVGSSVAAQDHYSD
jgi:hypothetical protein